MPKVNKLQSPKLRLTQSLLVATFTQNFMRFRCTVVEKRHQNFPTHSSVCDDLYHGCTFAWDIHVYTFENGFAGVYTYFIQRYLFFDFNGVGHSPSDVISEVLTHLWVLRGGREGGRGGGREGGREGGEEGGEGGRGGRGGGREGEYIIGVNAHLYIIAEIQNKDFS